MSAGPLATGAASRAPQVALVGCGLIGRKRAQALGPARLVACADLDRARADALAATVHGATASDDWRATVARPDVDLVGWVLHSARCITFTPSRWSAAARES